MTPGQFAKHYPLLYHMAEEGTWDSVRKHGLLSTSALLDLFDLSQKQREPIESQRRPESVTISHPEYGTAVIRDQKPIHDSKLLSALTDMSPREWYLLLNGRVFFWPTRERLSRLLGARPYRHRRHDVITVDSRRLLERYDEAIELSPINSGATVYSPTPRGTNTFRRLAEWPAEEGPRSGKLKKAVAELAVMRGIRAADISFVVATVEQWHGDRVLGEVWRA